MEKLICYFGDLQKIQVVKGETASFMIRILTKNSYAPVSMVGQTAILNLENSDGTVEPVPLLGSGHVREAELGFVGCLLSETVTANLKTGKVKAEIVITQTNNGYKRVCQADNNLEMIVRTF